MCSLPRVPGVRRPISGLTAVHTVRVLAHLARLALQHHLRYCMPRLTWNSQSFVPIDTIVSLMAEPPFDPSSSVVFTTSTGPTSPSLVRAVSSSQATSKATLSSFVLPTYSTSSLAPPSVATPGLAAPFGWQSLPSPFSLATVPSPVFSDRHLGYFQPYGAQAPVWRARAPIGQPSAIGPSSMLPTQAAKPAVVPDHHPMSSVVANGPEIAPPPVHALSDPVPAWPGAIAAAAPAPPPALPDRWPARGTTGNSTPGFGSRFGDRVLPIGPYPSLGSKLNTSPHASPSVRRIATCLPCASNPRLSASTWLLI